jgi:hypothetical protein
MGGPLIVVPVSALAAWHGCTLAGVMAGDATDSEAGLKAAADGVLADPATEWEECGTWVSDGPAVLMDSAEAGSDLPIEYPGGGMPEQAPVPLPAGRWRGRASHTWADQADWVGLVQLLPTES